MHCTRGTLPIAIGNRFDAVDAYEYRDRLSRHWHLLSSANEFRPKQAHLRLPSIDVCHQSTASRSSNVIVCTLRGCMRNSFAPACANAALEPCQLRPAREQQRERCHIVLRCSVGARPITDAVALPSIGVKPPAPLVALATSHSSSSAVWRIRQRRRQAQTGADVLGPHPTSASHQTRGARPQPRNCPAQRRSPRRRRRRTARAAAAHARTHLRRSRPRSRRSHEVRQISASDRQQLGERALGIICQYALDHACRQRAGFMTELAASQQISSALFPRLYHATDGGAWNSIKKHGLLSTTSLLDLYEIRGEERLALESRRRPRSNSLARDGYSEIILRDQSPMSNEALRTGLRSFSARLFAA